MNGTTVLDASAILAVVLNETGRDAVIAVSGVSLASSVNISEVRARLLDLGLSRHEVDSALQLVDMQEVPFNSQHAITAAELRQVTRAAGLSLGDRACLALAMQLGGLALTADRMWATINLPVQVQLIR